MSRKQLYESYCDMTSLTNEKKRKRANNNDVSVKKISNCEWNFEVDYNDHFETPLVAYQDIIPILLETAKLLNKSKSQLIIYDPYYCQGNMKSHLSSFGYTNVINNNEDFYANIETNQIPGTKYS